MCRSSNSGGTASGLNSFGTASTIQQIAPCGCGIPDGPLCWRDHDTSILYSYELSEEESSFLAARLALVFRAAVMVGAGINENSSFTAEDAEDAEDCKSNGT